MFGASGAEIEAAAAKGHTAHVRVVEPCDCTNCKAGARWFYCTRSGETIVAEYLVPGHVDSPYIPTPEAVREVERLHPGCLFIYIK